MKSKAVRVNRSGTLPPYLEALRTSGVPADLIVAQAEALGASRKDLLAFAWCLLMEDPASTYLLLGALKHWRPFLPLAVELDLRRTAALASGAFPGLDTLVQETGASRWPTFAGRILQRLGYPKGICPPQPLGRTGKPRVEIPHRVACKRTGTAIRRAWALPAPFRPLTGLCVSALRGRKTHPSIRVRTLASEIIAWMDAGRPLVLERLELNDFASRAESWRDLFVDTLCLRDGAGPETIERAHLAENGRLRLLPWTTTRLFRVRRLRGLRGIRGTSTVVAIDCPSLASLDLQPSILIFRRCPSLVDLGEGTHGMMLHLAECPGIRSIGLAEVNGEDFQIHSFGAIVLEDCPNLRYLPSHLIVERNMILRRMGPFAFWPLRLWIGRDLRIIDCPGIEEVPHLEVKGSIRFEGRSGLLRMAPGSSIGGDLDLRACHRLERPPAAVKVGGRLLLPPHLGGEVTADPGFFHDGEEKDEPTHHTPSNVAPRIRI